MKQFPQTLRKTIKIISILTLFFLFSATAFAENAYEIKVSINGYTGDELYLGYHLGNKQYIQDTVYRNSENEFVFNGKERLKGGVYLLIIPPQNNYLEILINENEQEFSIETELNDLYNSIRFQGKSSDNQLFYNYLNFLSIKRKQAEEISKEIEKAVSDTYISKLTEDGNKINSEVTAFIENLIKENPNSMTAALLKANLQIDFPVFAGTENEVQTKQWRYAQKHFFDNVDLGDPKLLRTPFLFQKIDYFVHKLQVQHPDTISHAIDYVLKKLEPAQESYKFYLIHFLNEYAKSKLVGMDAVYVHLAKNYYAKGKAPWTDAEQLEKILNNARSLEPLLVGEKAPDIQLLIRSKDEQSYDKPQTMSLYDFKSEFTLLFIWNNSNTSNNTALQLKEVYPALKQKGLKVFAVCLLDPTYSIEPVWKFIDDNQLNDWQHVCSKSKYSTYDEGLSQARKDYMAYTLPLIYLLDKDKKIISKRIAPNQISQVIDFYLNQNP